MAESIEVTSADFQSTREKLKVQGHRVGKIKPLQRCGYGVKLWGLVGTVVRLAQFQRVGDVRHIYEYFIIFTACQPEHQPLVAIHARACVVRQPDGTSFRGGIDMGESGNCGVRVWNSRLGVPGRTEGLMALPIPRLSPHKRLTSCI
jgi:hypothetical protein